MMRKVTTQKLLNEVNLMIDLLLAVLINLRAVRRKLTAQIKLTQKRSKS